MSVALTSGAFTRTAPALMLHRERCGIHHLLESLDSLDATTQATLTKLRRCIDVCESEPDLTALRVLALHAKLHRGAIASVPMRAKLDQLDLCLANGSVTNTPPHT